MVRASRRYLGSSSSVWLDAPVRHSKSSLIGLSRTEGSTPRLPVRFLVVAHGVDAQDALAHFALFTRAALFRKAHTEIADAQPFLAALALQCFDAAGAGLGEPMN